jgi:hypothetical protein
MRWRLLAITAAVPAAAALATAGCTSNLTIDGVATGHLARPPSPRPSGHVATLAATGGRAASLAVLSGAASITVSAAALPGELVRAWTPSGSGVRPELVVVNGAVQLYLGGTSGGQSGPDTVWVQLNSAVRWQLQFSGGASQTTVDMGSGAVSGIDFTAGSSLVTMTLPPPTGTVEVTLAGGASQVNIAVPAGVPARLRLFGGAGLAMLGGRAYSGLGGGRILAERGWAAATDRYDVAAPAGVSLISVTS